MIILRQVLKGAPFAKAIVKIGMSLKSKHHQQIKLAQIHETHCIEADEQIICLRKYADEIEPSSCQFHQHFTKVLRAVFLHLNFRFELFLAQEYWRKCAHKMLAKSTHPR
jgi:hypothetical protein